MHTEWKNEEHSEGAGPFVVTKLQKMAVIGAVILNHKESGLQVRRRLWQQPKT